MQRDYLCSVNSERHWGRAIVLSINNNKSSSLYISTCQHQKTSSSKRGRNFLLAPEVSFKTFLTWKLKKNQYFFRSSSVRGYIDIKRVRGSRARTILFCILGNSRNPDFFSLQKEPTTLQVAMNGQLWSAIVWAMSWAWVSVTDPLSVTYGWACLNRGTIVEEA